MSASEAITLLNHGHKLTRPVWAKGARVYRWTDYGLSTDTNPPRNYYRYDSDSVGNLPWEPTHADLTADDWVVLPS